MRQECSVFAREWRIKLYQKRSTSTTECRNLCTHVKRVLFRVAIAEGKYMSCLRGNNLFGIIAQIECVLFGAEHTKPIVVGISERERVLDGVAEREHAAVLFARSSCTAEGTRVTELPFGVAERKRVFGGGGGGLYRGNIFAAEKERVLFGVAGTEETCLVAGLQRWPI